MSDTKFEYRYNSILVLKSFFNEPEMKSVEEFKDQVAFNIDTSLRSIHSGRSIVTDLIIGLQQEEKEPEIFEIHTRHIFDLKSESDLVEEDDEGKFLNLPKAKLYPFVSIPFSTTRGIIKERLDGTRFSDLILPIINPDQIMPEEKVRILSLSDEEE